MSDAPGSLPLPAAGPLRLPRMLSWGAAALAGVAVLTALRLVWLAVQPAGLYPDEAQYWFWAQHPALGYYSKPPLLSWLIALSTAAFGDSEFAIRLPAPLLHAAVALLVYATGARLYDRRAGFWSALLYASLPGVSASAFIISTDAALLPFWAAALYGLVRAREPGRGRWWALVGISAGLGLLAKYAMAYWLISALGWVGLVPGERRHMRPLLAAVGLAALIYLPNLWWNASHGYVSYLHVRDNAELGGPLFHPLALLEFFGSQFGVFGPLGFAALIAVALPRYAWTSPRARLLALFAVPTLAMMMGVSFLSRAEPNWAAPAYVSASVLVVAWALARGWRAAVAVSIGLNLLLAGAVFTGGEALAAAGIALPAKYDPLHRLRGWRTLGEKVGEVMAAHPGLRLLADDRELVAALIYYVRPHPFDAAKWNPMRRIKDQWDLTNDLAGHSGESFVLVTEHGDLGEAQSFAGIEPAGTVTIAHGQGGERVYGLYIARDFLGYPGDRR